MEALLLVIREVSGTVYGAESQQETLRPKKSLAIWTFLLHYTRVYSNSTTDDILICSGCMKQPSCAVDVYSITNPGDNSLFPEEKFSNIKRVKNRRNIYTQSSPLIQQILSKLAYTLLPLSAPLMWQEGQETIAIIKKEILQ
eukprot:scaffold66659_cov61-Attheya_sp.AAC.4